ncbi:MAG TPA: GAF domain-containing protein, partial [Promineifilum sp.]|nr:GAF domain-containing protein [Promineifilum sp.]
SAIVDISIDYLHHIIPAHVISIALIDSERDQLIVQRSTHAHYPTGRIFSLAMFDALRQLERGHVYINRDLSPSRDRSLNMTEIVDLGGRSLMAVPLRYHEVTIGCVIIVLSEVRDFSAREINGAREIADSITVAIQNRQLLEAEQEARQRESILREVAASLALDLTPGELSRRILTMLDTVISFRSAAILLLEDGVLRLAAQHGDPVGYEQSDKLLARRPRSMWAAIESMQPVIIEDTSQSPDWVAIAGFEYIRAWMGVPLLVKGECVGLLAIDRDQPNTFDEKDRDLAMAFANQAAIAIENGRLFVRQQAATDELGRRYREREREFNVLYGITVTAVSKTDLESLLERLLELVIEAFGGSMAAIFLDGGNERGLELAASRSDSDGSNRRGDLELAAITARQTLVTEALCELVSGNLDLWPPTIDTFNILSGADLPDGWPGADGGSLAVLPLRSSGSNLGLFCLAYDSPGGVPDETIPLLVTVVDQIAVAVENIRLRQIARQAAIIEERERLAREIHDSVTQSIYSIGLFAGAAQGAAQTGNLVKTQQSAQSILDMTDLALRELRSLLFELRTELLARLGLVGALREQ